VTGGDGRSPAPLLEDAVAELLSPAVPEGLDEIVASLPRRPRFLGPEAWLGALRERTEEDGNDARGPRSIARDGAAGLYSRAGGGQPLPGSKEKSWSS